MDRPVSLVTGVSRGIGLAIAKDLMRRGHHVVGTARTKPDDFEGTFVAVDFGDAEATAKVLADIAAEYKPLRLVNNAGVSAPSPVLDADLELFDLMTGINLRAPMQAMQAVIPAMRAAGFGRIVNIGSRAALGKEGRIIYGATKGGLLAMSRTIALETARDGITVNVVSPGPIETAMIRQNYPEGSDTRAALTSDVPMARFGQPEEIAAAATYFLSDEAGYTTGQVLYVCGGLSVGTAPI